MESGLRSHMESLESIYPSETQPRPLAAGDFVLLIEDNELYLVTSTGVGAQIVKVTSGNRFREPTRIERCGRLAAHEVKAMLGYLSNFRRLTRAEAVAWMQENLKD